MGPQWGSDPVPNAARIGGAEGARITQMCPVLRAPALTSTLSQADLSPTKSETWGHLLQDLSQSSHVEAPDIWTKLT